MEMRNITVTLLMIFATSNLHYFETAADAKIGETFRIICYYCIGNNNLYPQNLDPFLCTMILVCQIIPINNEVVPNRETDLQVYPQILALKNQNPNLKILIMIQEGNSTHGLSHSVLEPDSRTQLVNSVVDFIVEHDFDGVDVDWEFPAWHAENPNETHLFTLFLEELNSTMKNNLVEGKSILSVDVAAPTTIVDVAYEPVEIAKNVDFINLMSYDYHFFHWYTPATGHNSPLFARNDENGYFATENTNFSAYYWLSFGISKEKLNIGMATYGHSFTLLDPQVHGVHAPAIGPGSYNGWPRYYEVCEYLKSNGTRVFDDESMVPYAYRDTDWISYDDVDSITFKTQWAFEQGFGGIMAFNLNNDDWSGSCDSQTKFPLHKAILDALGIFTDRDN